MSVNYTESIDCTNDLMVCLVHCLMCLTNATGTCFISNCGLTNTFSTIHFDKKRTFRNPISGESTNNSIESCPYDTTLNVVDDVSDQRCMITFRRPPTCDVCSTLLSGFKGQTQWSFRFDKKSFYIVVSIVVVAFCLGLLIGTTCSFCRSRRRNNVAKPKWNLPLEKDAASRRKSNDQSKSRKNTQLTDFSGCSWPTNISTGQIEQKNAGKMDT